MPIRLSSIRPENRTIKISELNLHWIGILLLCLSTLSTAVIQRGMLRLDGASPAEMEQIMASGATAQWAVQAMLLTMTATLALPLYAKLLVEAVDQTEDKRRLLLELGCCALAAYDQEAMDELLGLSSEVTDSKEAEFTVYACCVGRPR